MTQSTTSLVTDVMNKAIAAQSRWALISIEEREELLMKASRALIDIDFMISNSMTYQTEHTKKLISEVTLMPGPTGETNELYYAPRGICLFTLERDKRCTVPVSALLAAALMAGNSVVACTDSIYAQQATQALNTILPEGLIQLLPYDTYPIAIESSINLGVIIGGNEEQVIINRQFSKRSGAILPIVLEDPENIKVVYDPMLGLRFVTERVRTINITAVGGNATLLELGSEH